MRPILLTSVALLTVVLCGCPADGGGGTGGGGGTTGRVSGHLNVFAGAGASAKAQPTLAGVLASRPRPRLDVPLSRLFKFQSAPALAKASPTTEWIAGEVIVRLEEKKTAAQALKLLKASSLRLTHGGFASEYLHLLKATHLDGSKLTLGETRELAASLKKLPGVRFTELNQWQHHFAVPNDKLYSAQWHYPALNLPAAWDVTQGSASVIVADLDTGVVPHPDLDPRLLPGIDMISDPANGGDGDARDDDPLDMGGDEPNGASSWHGTHTAGTIAAASNNTIGISGVDWNAKLLPVRVLGKTGGTLFDIAAGISWATGKSVPGSRANTSPAVVLNMSLGGTSEATSTYQDVIDAAPNAVIVVAAGNSNEDASHTIPCVQQGVICVGATRFSGKRASYSNFGAPVTVMAPGGETAEDANGDGYPDGVLSTYRDANNQPSLYFNQGTSMATPHVTGIVALMKAVNPQLTFAQARMHLTSTANNASTCSEGCGAGMVNALAAVQGAKGVAPTGPAKLSANTTELFFAGNATTVTLGISNLGSQPLTVTATTSGTAAQALSFPNGAGATLAAGGVGGIVVAANLNGLPDGISSAQLDLASNGGNVTVNVRLRVGGGSGASAEVGLAYQDDTGAWQVGAKATATAADGYAFSIDTPPGKFYVIAAIDENGNNTLDDGEPIGIYPTTDSPEQLDVQAGSGFENIDFPVVPHKAISSDPPPGIGSACTTSCPNNGSCITMWPGGYCSADCATASCPLGSSCIDSATASYCLSTCTAPAAGQSTCRTGYVCYDDGTGKGVCLPACASNADCGTTGTCNTSTGYCQ